MNRPGPFRVLMIAPTSFFADYGCHVRILEEARTLQRLGSQVAVCTYRSGRDLPDVDIRRTLSIPWRQGYEVGSSRHKIAFDALLSLRCLQAMWQVKPHIIHAHLHEGALIGYVLARLWGLPLVFDFQGSMSSEMVDHRFLQPEGTTFEFMRGVERWIDHLPHRILTSSQNVIDILVSEFGCHSHKITCLPDCVDTEVFKPVARDESWVRLKQAWGIPTDRLVVVYLGKLAEYQGIGHLLRAAQIVCARRDDVHFLVAGYPFVDQYRQLAADLGIGDRVTLPGRVRYEEAPRILSLGDIAVAPKLSQTEGAGKLLNYMAMGLPTVAFDTAVSREYLGEAGTYAERGNVDALADCLSALLGDPQRRAELGDRLSQRARDCFSWDDAGRQILSIYGSLAQRV